MAGVFGEDGDGVGGLQGSGVGGRLKGRLGGVLGWGVGRSLDLLGKKSVSMRMSFGRLAGSLAEVARTWPDRCPGFARLWGWLFSEDLFVFESLRCCSRRS